ncbi:MAG: helix-turn-helix transcriptional regulator [Nitrososphaeraceae archaeon]
MSAQPKIGAESLFFELAGELRLPILIRLTHNSYRLSKLAPEIDATMQEAHRNIVRLVDSGLVSKYEEGQFALTPYGKIIVSLIPGYAFLSSQQEYFLEHSLGDLPTKFIQRLSSFQGCEVVHGVMAIIQRWKNLYYESNSYIKEIMAQVPLDLIETLGNKVETGIKFSYIFPRNPIIPRGRRKILQKIGWQKLLSRGLVERRMVESVNIMTIFNEKHSCVLFPNLKGEPDLNVMFYGDSHQFHDWCEDFFSYQWEKAGTFEESKLSHEV